MTAVVGSLARVPSQASAVDPRPLLRTPDPGPPVEQSTGGRSPAFGAPRLPGSHRPPRLIEGRQAGRQVVT